MSSIEATATEAAESLASMLAMTSGPDGSAVEFLIGGKSLTGTARETVAQMLAEEAMRIRCGKSPLFARWRARRDGGAPLTGSQKETVATYAGIGFGRPDKPANENHLQGHVAELFWHLLLAERIECPDGRRLIRAHSAKPDPLEPGGDGLVIYQQQDTLVFRLWEIKKHDSDSKLPSETIGKASKQLLTRGQEYLAKLAGPETIDQDGPIGDLYANMVELWLDRSRRAGAGISIGISHDKATTSTNTFRSLATTFPDFSNAGQLEGLMVAIPDFPGFATRVREIVWSGL